MIDIITLRGTGEQRNYDGTPAGMLHDIAKLLDTDKFSCFEPVWPAAIGPTPDLWGPSMATSVRIGVAAGVKAIQDSPNVCGLLTYSLGGIVGNKILEGARSGLYKNANGTPLEIAFTVNVANPMRRAGESVGNLCPPNLFGLHGQRGQWPIGIDVLEYANPNDIICASPANSPLRIIDVGIEPFSFIEGARIGNVTPLIFNELLQFLQHDPVANFERYSTAVRGVLGYLTPWPDGEHVRYSAHTMPGTSTVWTTHAAEYLNANY
ncbi:hypothetical protein JK358_19360 [Nocardia sp. 2]|uniref:Lysin B n=1 Tax=Nocardia acididurans TaxID=2802282 RepID=A0ABS1M941_9NOCA|nr:hypothetical protein [Nocardia acididurans]MBL1076560.1 hypothetical protein [Nocardia acididurans]